MRVKVKVELSEQLVEDVIVRYRRMCTKKFFVFGYHGRNEKTYYFIVDTFEHQCDIETVIALLVPQHINIISVSDISSEDSYSDIPLNLVCNDILNNLQISCYAENIVKTRYFNELSQAREILNYYRSMDMNSI